MVLPDGIDLSFCRYFLRHYSRGPNDDSGPITIRTVAATDHPDSKKLTSWSLRAKDGNLYLRTQTVLAAVSTDGKITWRGGYMLVDHLTDSSCDYKVCGHLGEWARVAEAYFFDSKLRPEANDLLATAHNESHDTRECDCSGHQEDCHHGQGFDRKITEQVLHMLIGRDMTYGLLHQDLAYEFYPHGGIYLNTVHGCRFCPTDFCLGLEDVEGLGRVMVLTQWKDLGGPDGDELHKWFAHRESAPPHISLAEGLDPPHEWERCEVGSAYCQFEDFPVGWEGTMFSCHPCRLPVHHLQSKYYYESDIDKEVFEKLGTLNQVED
jgi:hypothetical protein